MRNLTVVSEVDYDQNVFLVNISWVGPSRPEGRIERFEIAISSRLVQELYHDTVSVSVSLLVVCTYVHVCMWVGVSVCACAVHVCTCIL